MFMKDVCWMGQNKIETLTVEDPKLLNPRDAIIKVTKTAICGSDLHLSDGVIPTMEAGDLMGHEFKGIVEEAGKVVTNPKRGDRGAVTFTIACENCHFGKKISGRPVTIPTLELTWWKRLAAYVGEDVTNRW
jgi:threonine dehydrogenase-like Zn-dependent dehydrogenase